jgi:sulfite exporter TauE/SafE
LTWFTESTYLLVFAAGALGSFGHCIGMCGPLVAAFSLPLGKGRLLPANLLYHLGRVTTYGLIGGATGLTGSFVGVASHIESFQKNVMTATGLLIVLTGLVLGGWVPILRAPEKEAGRYPVVGRIVRLVAEGGSPGAFFPLGLALGFLPCGLVYGALLSSARVGMEAGNHAQGFLNGCLMMVLFGAGTVPGLLVVAKTAGLLGARLRARLYRAAAVVMIVVGLVFAVRGAML